MENNIKEKLDEILPKDEAYSEIIRLYNSVTKNKSQY